MTEETPPINNARVVTYHGISGDRYHMECQCGVRTVATSVLSVPMAEAAKHRCITDDRLVECPDCKKWVRVTYAGIMPSHLQLLGPNHAAKCPGSRRAL